VKREACCVSSRFTHPHRRMCRSEDKPCHLGRPHHCTRSRSTPVLRHRTHSGCRSRRRQRHIPGREVGRRHHIPARQVLCQGRTEDRQPPTRIHSADRRFLRAGASSCTGSRGVWHILGRGLLRAQNGPRRRGKPPIARSSPPHDETYRGPSCVPGALPAAGNWDNGRGRER
jgi:hypothetical protein